jgi:hypothetical protein
MSTVLDWVGIVLTLGAVAFAALAWENTRARQPFRVSEAPAGVGVLTRTGWREVTIGTVSVPHHRALWSYDAEAEIPGRTMKRDDWIVLDTTKIPSGEILVVHYSYTGGLGSKKKRTWAAPVIVTWNGPTHEKWSPNPPASDETAPPE